MPAPLCYGEADPCPTRQNARMDRSLAAFTAAPNPGRRQCPAGRPSHPSRNGTSRSPAEGGDGGRDRRLSPRPYRHFEDAPPVPVASDLQLGVHIEWQGCCPSLSLGSIAESYPLDAQPTNRSRTARTESHAVSTAALALRPLTPLGLSPAGVVIRAAPGPETRSRSEARRTRLRQAPRTLLAVKRSHRESPVPRAFPM